DARDPTRVVPRFACRGFDEVTELAKPPVERVLVGHFDVEPPSMSIAARDDRFRPEPRRIGRLPIVGATPETDYQGETVRTSRRDVTDPAVAALILHLALEEQRQPEVEHIVDLRAAHDVRQAE